MKIKDLLERSGVQSLSGGCGEEEITALTYDSRKAQTGSLFFCLRGARSNGEDFAPGLYVTAGSLRHGYSMSDLSDKHFFFINFSFFYFFAIITY